MASEPPVAPGDLLFFHMSGNRFLVVRADPPDGTKQFVGGLMSTSRTCEFAVMSLEWKGFASHWTIHRLVL